MDPAYVSVSQEDYRQLKVKAALGKVLGRNIERAAAGWALVFSLLLVLLPPGPLFFAILTRWIPLPIWGWAVGVVSAARVVVLIVNGWWPVTLHVRLAFSIVSMFLIWAVLVMLSWVSASTMGILYPSAVLAPLAATVELLCYLAVRTRLEAEGRGALNVGRSADRPDNIGQRPSAGAGERLGEAHGAVGQA